MTGVSQAVHTRRVRTSSARYWEIDTLRGVAIVMMVIFHLMWDLYAYQVMPELVLWAGFWKYFQRTTASLFIILVGVSMTISYRRAKLSHGGTKRLFRKFLLRGLKIMGSGIAVSVVMWLAGSGFAHFGVLHLIGFSIIAGYPFLRFRWLNLLMWLAFLAIGWLVQNLLVETLWFVWAGLTPRYYAPPDFFPVFPWFGVALLGIFVGNMAYGDRGRRFFLPDRGDFSLFQALQFFGRHSLLIYIIHQPLLIAGLGLYGLIPLGF